MSCEVCPSLLVASGTLAGLVFGVIKLLPAFIGGRTGTPMEKIIAGQEMKETFNLLRIAVIFFLITSVLALVASTSSEPILIAAGVSTFIFSVGVLIVSMFNLRPPTKST